MLEVENDNEVEEGTVIQEIQSGYIMHDRLLKAFHGWGFKKNY